MKQTIALLFTFMTITTALRRIPTPAGVPTCKGIHRMGWGIDEEFVEPLPEEMDYAAIKPVKRVVPTNNNNLKKEQDYHEHHLLGPLLWGVTRVSELDDTFGLE